MNIKVLPAHNGDCLLISFNDGDTIRNILIDGGVGRTSLPLLKELKAIQTQGQFIDLLIVTHIDDDHIGGIVNIFGKNDPVLHIIKGVWFNSGTILGNLFDNPSSEERSVQVVNSEQLNISVKQGNTLERQLKRLGIWDEAIIHTGLSNINVHGATIHILSPNMANLEALNKKWETETSKPENISSPKRDYQETLEALSQKELPQEDIAIPNGSSIAILIEFKGLRSIYLADAHPKTVEKALEDLGYSKENPIEVDIIKVSHHGSSHNISESLLRLWRCKNYVISTNGAKHGLPNKICLSKLISTSEPKVSIYFNYKEIKEQIFLAEDFAKYDFQAFDLSESKMNYTVIIK